MWCLFEVLPPTSRHPHVVHYLVIAHLGLKPTNLGLSLKFSLLELLASLMSGGEF